MGNKDARNLTKRLSYWSDRVGGKKIYPKLNVKVVALVYEF